MNARLGLTALPIVGLLIGCAGADDTEGVELGVYALSPEHRDFHIGLLDDGTFRTHALEGDLYHAVFGVWSAEDVGVTLLLPDEDEEGFEWSTVTGFTDTESVRLEAGPGDALTASFVDARTDANTTQRFVPVDAFPPP